MKKNTIECPKIDQTLSITCEGLVVIAKVKYLFRYGLTDQQIVLDVNDNFYIKQLSFLNDKKSILVVQPIESPFYEKKAKIEVLS